MKLLKISIITLVCFGVIHFIADGFLIKAMPFERYLVIKALIGTITVSIAVVVFISAVYVLLKFIAKKL